MDEAEVEKQRIPEIENMILEAENKTKEARNALSGAESNADMALKLAQEAQNIAQNASKVISFYACLWNQSVCPMIFKMVTMTYVKCVSRQIVKNSLILTKFDMYRYI